ncbi:hypothetical protein Cpir12675_006072 [Ceratocystis pirilliformis]|uniref:Uncharacterized protein n=1 Tax=Ceratocystis pirilliformis TaxID=259994 RepID=A0ABR3YKG1_9PEZI
MSFDFFYVCPAHLKDRKFCSPAFDAEAEKTRIEAKHKEEIDAEVEKLKGEYAAEKAKEEEKGGKEKNKDGEKTGSKKDTETEKKEKADQKKAFSKASPQATLEEPRVFILVQQVNPRITDPLFPSLLSYLLPSPPALTTTRRTFFDIRKQKRRDLELAKRQYQQSQMNRERMAKADFWPTVPGEIPKK